MKNFFDNAEIRNTFIERKDRLAFIVDTDILSEISKNPDSLQVFNNLLKKKVVLFYSLPSLLELGFGIEGNVDESEMELCKLLEKTAGDCEEKFNIPNLTHSGDVHARALLMTSYNEIKGNVIPVSPGRFTWMGAKKILIEYMETRNVKPKNIQRFQIDALINHSAWNIGAFIWSNNLKDHLLLNYFMFKESRKSFISDTNTSQYIADHFSPIFNTDMMRRLLNEEKFNVYEELKNHTRDDDILNVLDIASKL